jgi:hypothetical protein
MPAGKNFWIEEGMISKELKNVDINKDGKVDYFCFSVWNQFLHANHPLGWIRRLTVRIDGEEISPHRIFFVLRDQWIGIEQISMISDIWWMLREEAKIYVKQDDEKICGTHNVECIIEISLHTNTRTIDRYDIYPRLVLNLQSEMCTF